MRTYSFGLPAVLIWSVHIAVGLLLFYIGRRIVAGRTVSSDIGQLLIVLGTLASLYHAHIWYTYYRDTGALL